MARGPPPRAPHCPKSRCRRAPLAIEGLAAAAARLNLTTLLHWRYPESPWWCRATSLDESACHLMQRPHDCFLAQNFYCYWPPYLPCFESDVLEQRRPSKTDLLEPGRPVSEH